MSAAIARIRHPAVRVPLWSLWFPFALAKALLTALVLAPDRLLTAGYWRTVAGVYCMGIDGL